MKMLFKAAFCCVVLQLIRTLFGREALDQMWAAIRVVNDNIGAFEQQQLFFQFAPYNVAFQLMHELWKDLGL